MQLTVKDIYELQEGLSELANKELPVAVAFKLQLNLRKVADEYQSAQKLRDKIVQKYKEKDLENGRVRIKEDKLETFKQEIDELMAQEVKVNLQKIDINDLDDIKVSAKALSLTHKILKGEMKDD
ncbi:hypothetical protein ACTWQB_16560 [Piscibacillus sp. B03]|uniref:hypothetical protein n=1 Tax=Piscibacillus sp. B03 TaxID=3457430 RepID=UPI003FCC4E4D